MQIKWNVTYLKNVTYVPPDNTFQCVKMQVQVFYSLISSLKTYHLFINVPFQLPGEHTVLQPFRRIELIVHIAISVLPVTHFYPNQVQHLRVNCLAQ